MANETTTPPAPVAAAPAAAAPVVAAPVEKVAAAGGVLDAAPEPKVETADVDVKWAEGMDPKLSSEFAATAKELGLDSAKAQKVADIYVKAQKASDENFAVAIAKQNTDWVEAMKADKEIGGAEYAASVVNAQKALRKFGTPELSKLINGYGLSNNPEMVRIFSRIGKAMAEDSISGTSDAGDTKQNTEEAALRRAYPKSYARIDASKA